MKEAQGKFLQWKWQEKDEGKKEQKKWKWRKNKRTYNMETNNLEDVSKSSLVLAATINDITVNTPPHNVVRAET